MLTSAIVNTFAVIGGATLARSFNPSWNTWTYTICTVGAGALAYYCTRLVTPANPPEKKKKSPSNWKMKVWKHSAIKTNDSRLIVCNIVDQADKNDNNKCEKCIPISNVNGLVNYLIRKCNPQTDVLALNINSTGGVVEVYGLAAYNLKRLRDHGFVVHALVDQYAASGGYLMVAATSKIFASPWSALGSVGAISKVMNYSDLLERVGIKVVKAVSGDRKCFLDGDTAVTEESVDTFNEKVKSVGQLFLQTVKTFRPAVDEQKIMNADVFRGEEAKSMGLVDEFQTSDMYIQEALKSRTIVHLYLRTKVETKSNTSWWDILNWFLKAR